MSLGTRKPMDIKKIANIDELVKSSPKIQWDYVHFSIRRKKNSTLSSIAVLVLDNGYRQIMLFINIFRIYRI